MARSLIALGSNLGDPAAQLRQAIAAIAALPHTRLVATSRQYLTQPVGGPGGQSPFANAAAVVETGLEPLELLRALREIETAGGRQRSARWAARHIDLDLLLCDQQVFRSPQLELPHPRMSFRPFVLDPAVEIAGDWRHPELAATLAELHARLHSGDDAIVIDGGTVEDREFFASQVRDRCNNAVPLCQDQQSLALGLTPDAAAERPRLALHLMGQASDVPRPGCPTLRLDATARSQAAVADLAAALQCVWPDLCCRGADG